MYCRVVPGVGPTRSEGRKHGLAVVTVWDTASYCYCYCVGYDFLSGKDIVTEARQLYLSFDWGDQLDITLARWIFCFFVRPSWLSIHDHHHASV